VCTRRPWKVYKILLEIKIKHCKVYNNLDTLLEIDFKRLTSDPCLYVKMDKENIIIYILGVYVDDILLTGENDEIANTKGFLKHNLKITGIGNADYIIGINFEKWKDGFLFFFSIKLNA